MKRLSCLLLALSMLLTLTACGGGTGGSQGKEATASTSAQPESTAQPKAQEPEAQESAVTDSGESSVEAEPAPLIRQVPLPISDGESLSMWIRLNFMDFDPIQSNYDSPVLQKAQELTGVNMEYVEVSSASESETFNLMVAGGDYTDLIYNFVKLYTGGVDSAIENDIIVDLTDYMDLTPCYESILASDEDVRRAATADSGAIGAFYSIYGSTPYSATGLTIRGDWLDKLGLDAPVTYEDFEQVLLAFKSAYDPEYPLYLPSCGTLSSITMGYEFAYNIAGDNVTLFAQKDGKVFFSATQDSFREYLTMMHRWYEEGIISKDFATNGDWMFMNGEYQAMMSTGDTGLVVLGAGLYSEFEPVGQDYDPDYRLEGVVNPRISADIPAGNTPGSRVSDGVFSVTGGNPELACKWCDFWYTETGSMLATYGIEGESYTLSSDGTPEYTDLILSDPNYSERSMKNLYSFNTCCIMDPEKELQGVSEHGLAAIEVWSGDAPSESFSTITMTSLSMTSDESTQYGIICADAQTYCLEHVLQFINGSLSVEKDWDNFVSTLEGMGVDEATEIVQAAYDRYLAR